MLPRSPAIFSLIVVWMARSANLSWNQTSIHSGSGPLTALCHAMVMYTAAMRGQRDERVRSRDAFFPRSKKYVSSM